MHQHCQAAMCPGFKVTCLQVLSKQGKIVVEGVNVKVWYIPISLPLDVAGGSSLHMTYVNSEYLYGASERGDSDQNTEVLEGSPPCMPIEQCMMAL